MSPATSQARELAARESDGIHVLLLWNPDENAVTVSVEDERVGDRFQLEVAPRSCPRRLLPPLRLRGLTRPKLPSKKENPRSA